MKPADFLKQVTENRLLPSYLFLGEERYFHEELLRAALAKLLAPADREFNLQRRSAGELEPEELLRIIETPPFFGDRRVFCLDRFEEARPEIEEIVLKAASHLADGLFFFILAAKLDGRKKNHQELQKRFNVVECAKITGGEIPGWVKKMAQAVGLNLTSVQTGVVARRIGADLFRLRTELEKIRIFAGEAGSISDRDLDDLLPPEPEPNIFALIDAVAGRNPRLGLPRLTELLEAGEPELKILATLSKQFRNIAAALEARRLGLNRSAFATALGINPYVAEKSFLQSGGFQLPELARIINRLLWADFRIKTGRREPRLELELAVVEICVGEERNKD